MDATGPDGAPRTDGLDLRWSSDYLAIVTTNPDLEAYLWPLLAQAWDQGAREHPAGHPNPFWHDNPPQDTPHPPTPQDAPRTT